MTLVTSAVGERHNVMAAAWAMPLDFALAKVLLVVDKSSYTRELIEASGEFALNLQAARAGGRGDRRRQPQGRDGDKFAAPGSRTFLRSALPRRWSPGAPPGSNAASCASRTTSVVMICSLPKSWPRTPIRRCFRTAVGGFRTLRERPCTTSRAGAFATGEAFEVSGAEKHPGLRPACARLWMRPPAAWQGAPVYSAREITV